MDWVPFLAWEFLPAMGEARKKKKKKEQILLRVAVRETVKRGC